MNTISYNTTETTANSLAKRIAQEVQKASVYHLALSGGKEAVHLYRALVKESIDWSKVHIYFSYEIVQGVGTGFNYILAQGHLLNHIDIPATNIHPIRTDNSNPQQEVERYIREELSTLPRLGGYPRFDMVVIEMTKDGQAVGIYQGQEELFLAEEIYMVSKHPNQEKTLITSSFPLLESAKGISFYAFGGESRFVIGNIVNLMPQAKAYPANFLIAHCPWVYLYADAESMREKSYSIY